MCIATLPIPIYPYTLYPLLYTIPTALVVQSYNKKDIVEWMLFYFLHIKVDQAPLFLHLDRNKMYFARQRQKILETKSQICQQK